MTPAMLPKGFTLLQITPALDAGGVERTTLDVSRAVVAAGGRSLVASAGGRLERELAAGGGRLVRLPLTARGPLALLANARRLRALIAAERPSIVHARSRAPAWSALWAARREGVAFVTTYAGVYNARSALKRLYNSVMARGDLVIANSYYTRRHLLAAHGTDPARVIAIPRGIDLRRFDPEQVSPERVAAMRGAFGLGLKETRAVFLLAARLTRWKGHAFALEAFARASKAEGFDAVLVLAGDDQGRADYRRELAARIDALALGDRVRLVGHLDDMSAAYLAADVALVPSLEPEAFGRTAVEPQAMGRPVIVADHGAPAETVEDDVTGLRVAPGGVEAWALAMAMLARDPARRAALGAAGRAASARFGVDAMTGATLQAYAALLAARA